MKYVLPATITSQSELALCARELQAYQRWLEATRLADKAGSSAKHRTAPDLGAPTLALLAAERDQAISDETLASALAYLEQLQTSAQILHINTAQALPLEGQQKITQWLRANIHPTILVEFAYSAALAGGVVVRTGTRLHDYSFARQITEHRANLVEAIHRV